MTRLDTSPAIAHPDDVYEDLVDMHRGLDERESAVVNAKLILLLANHIGDDNIVRQAIGLARKSASARRRQGM